MLYISRLLSLMYDKEHIEKHIAVNCGKLERDGSPKVIRPKSPPMFHISMNSADGLKFMLNTGKDEKGTRQK